MRIAKVLKSDHLIIYYVHTYVHRNVTNPPEKQIKWKHELMTCVACLMNSSQIISIVKVKKTGYYSQKMYYHLKSEPKFTVKVVNVLRTGQR